MNAVILICFNTTQTYYLFVPPKNNKKKSNCRNVFLYRLTLNSIKIMISPTIKYTCTRFFYSKIIVADSKKNWSTVDTRMK